MSEGLEILHVISTRGGCLLSELANELGCPKSSVQGWVSMLCSTGYLKKTDTVSIETKKCSCKTCRMCSACCNCTGVNENLCKESRIEVTERGLAAIRRKWNEKTGKEVIPGNGGLPRDNICAQ